MVNAEDCTVVETPPAFVAVTLMVCAPSVVVGSVKEVLELHAVAAPASTEHFVEEIAEPLSVTAKEIAGVEVV